MLAASLDIVFCRRSSCSVRDLQLFSLLDTTSSSCAQRLSFALPQAIGVFSLKPSRSLSSLVRCELVMWVFSWLVFSILSFTASREEEISSRTTLQSFTWAAVDTTDLDDVEIDLLRSPQSFEGLLLRCRFRMIVIINGQVTKKVRPRLPGAWDKAPDFYRFAKSAKIRLWLIYLNSHSSLGMYRGLRSGPNSKIINYEGSP